MRRTITRRWRSGERRARAAMDGRARRILSWTTVDDGASGARRKLYGAFRRSTGALACAVRGYK